MQPSGVKSRFYFQCRRLPVGMNKTAIEAELPAELTAQAHFCVQQGWARDFNELLAEALRRFLESHAAPLTEAFVINDVRWGLHGTD
jgi:hypothetical protein